MLYRARPAMPSSTMPSRSMSISPICCEKAWSFFFLGHEYGHIVRGHLDYPNHSPIALNGKVNIQELEHSWSRELAADEIGVHLSTVAMHYGRQLSPAFGAAGAELFLSTLNVMERAVSILRCGDDSALRLDSHPPHKFDVKS